MGYRILDKARILQDTDTGKLGISPGPGKEPINVSEHEAESPLSGKVLYVHGDSICAGAGYAGGYGKCIADTYKMTLVNEGVNGATFAENIPNRSSITTILKKSTAYKNADYILLEGGVNDAWNGEAQLGTMTSSYSDSFDTSTTLGGLEKCLYLLRRNCSNKKIGFVFPHGGMLADTHDWNAKFKPAMKKVLQKWGVPYIDIELCAPRVGNYGIGGLKTIYTTDGTHPNHLGYTSFYLYQIAEWMQGSYPLTDKYIAETPSSSDYYVSDVLYKNYQPNDMFSTEVKIDWENGDYIEAEIDCSDCTRAAGEDILSLGIKDIDIWSNYNFHAYYIKASGTTSKDKVRVQVTKGTGDDYGYSQFDTPITSSAVVVLKITKDAIYVNGGTKSLDTLSVVMPLWIESNTFEIGSKNDGAISHAKYNYIKLYKKAISV